MPLPWLKASVLAPASRRSSTFLPCPIRPSLVSLCPPLNTHPWPPSVASWPWATLTSSLFLSPASPFSVPSAWGALAQTFVKPPPISTSSWLRCHFLREDFLGDSAEERPLPLLPGSLKIGLKESSPDQHQQPPESYHTCEFGVWPQTHWIRCSGVRDQNLVFNKPSRQSGCTFTFENL